MATAAAASHFFVQDGRPLKFYIDPGSIGRPNLIQTLKDAGACVASDPGTCDIILVQSDTSDTDCQDWGTDKTVLQSAWVSKSLQAGKLLKNEDGWGGCRLAVGHPSGLLENLHDHSPLQTPRVEPATSVNGLPPSSNGSSHLSSHSWSEAGVHAPEHSPPAIDSQNPMPQLNPQTMQQPFFHFPVPPQSATATIDPAIYNAVLLDVIRNAGFNFIPLDSLPPGFAIPNGMQPGLFLMNPMLNNTSQHPTPLQPSDSTPTACDSSTPYDARSPSSRMSSPAVDVKGKGKAKAMPRALGGPKSLKASAPSRKKAKIFTSDCGDALNFYVALDFQKRSEIISPIRAHGGEITTEATAADFAILNPVHKNNGQKKRDLESLLETVTASGGTVVKREFIFDSVAAKTLLNPSGYHLESVQPRTNSVKPAEKARTSPTLKCAHLPSPSPPPVDTRIPYQQAGSMSRYSDTELEYVLRYAEVLYKRDRDMSETTLAKKLHLKMPHRGEEAWRTLIRRPLRDKLASLYERELLQPEVDPADDHVVVEEKGPVGSTSNDPYSPSPSPPPPETRVPHHTNSFRYPDIEVEYVLRYAEVLYKRDRDMSDGTLARKIYLKMPHHTEEAWRTFIKRPLREKLAEVQRRVYRRNNSESESDSDQSVQHESAKRRKLSHTSAAPKNSRSEDDVAVDQDDASANDDLQTDLFIAAHYFANGADSEQTEGDEAQDEKDARIWRKLAEQTPCRTEDTWEAFWSKHHAEVMQLYTMLVEAEDGVPS